MMFRSDREAIEIDVEEVTVETDKAILIWTDGEAFWIPKSQIDESSEVQGKGDSGTLLIPEWLAKEKGIL